MSSYQVISPIFVSVQPSSTTLYGVPFPLPTPQGRRDSQLRTRPQREIRMLRKATPRTWRPLRQIHEGRSARDARGSKAKPPRPANSIIQSDCHLPAMYSADWRLRLVSRYANIAASLIALGLVSGIGLFPTTCPSRAEAAGLLLAGRLLAPG